jgi:3-hydroxyisobutyrate dehydrogenase-like beta-hydroxyacid dehydrogenase
MIESKQNIGVVGLGRMGTAIANNILKSGFSLVITIVAMELRIASIFHAS